MCRGVQRSSLDIVYFNLRDTPVLRAEGESIDLAWPAERHVPLALEQGLACSLYFIMPGIGFALRANGRCGVRGTGGARVLTLHVDALFLHCSRAKVRAQFWTPRVPTLPLSEAEGAGSCPLRRWGSSRPRPIC